MNDIVTPILERFIELSFHDGYNSHIRVHIKYQKFLIIRMKEI